MVPEIGPTWLASATKPARYGNVLHASGRLPAVMWQPFVYPERPELEVTEVRALLCSGVLGLASAAHDIGVELPNSLLIAAVDQREPAESILAAGAMTLAVVNSHRHLGVSWQFDEVRATAILTPTGYIFVIAEQRSPLTVLESIDIPDPGQGSM